MWLLVPFAFAADPTAAPDAEPTAEPTAEPAAEPTAEPAPDPAAEPTAEPAPDAPPADAPPDAPAPDLGAAEPLGLISKPDLRQLKPSPFHLPPNPRGQVDFTAYTLEWGEVKLGLVNITVGVLPHVQIGTSVPLDVLGVPNVTAKVHATEGGPFDIAAYGNYYVLPRDEIQASHLSFGGVTSFTIGPHWGIHVGGGYTRLAAEGSVDLTSLGSMFALVGAPAPVVPFSLSGETFTVDFATDVRFNRRDSIILRGESILWARSDTDIPAGLTSIVGLDEALAVDGWMTPDRAYAASIAWQLAWEHIEARVGVGVSSAPYGWLLQSVELCYRFGGKTRVRERQLRTSYATNVEEVEVERAREAQQAEEAKRKEREAARAAKKAAKKK